MGDAELKAIGKAVVLCQSLQYVLDDIEDTPLFKNSYLRESVGTTHRRIAKVLKIWHDKNVLGDNLDADELSHAHTYFFNVQSKLDEAMSNICSMGYSKYDTLAEATLIISKLPPHQFDVLTNLLQALLDGEIKIEK